MVSVIGRKRKVNRGEHEGSGVERLLGSNLPINLGAEKSVLSAILLNGSGIATVVDFLRADEFYSKKNREIFAAIVAVSDGGRKEVDLLTVQNYLESSGKLELCGGIEYLIELQENIPAIGLLEQHAKIVKEKAVLRELIYSASEIIGSCYQNNGETVDEIIDAAEKRIFGISTKISSPGFAKLDKILKKTFQHLADVKASKEGTTGIPTGFVEFDRMTSGMQKSDLLILAARPSMGKTALAVNIALNAWEHEFSVGIFSLEMSSEQLVLRMLSAESEIPHQKIRNAMVSSNEWIELTNVAAQLANAKIFIDDTPGISIMELRARARKLKLESNIDFLIIDYLQLLSANQRYENRTQEISAISRALKGIAKELEVPVLALSQLSRSLENRMDKRPVLSDLRESGAIEQDGDVIFFIYRDVIYNQDTENPDISEIIIGKQRNGPVGSFYLRFNGEITKFENIS